MPKSSSKSAPKSIPEPGATMTTHAEEGGWTEWLDEEGKRHRNGGPAVEYPNGLKMWYQHGALDRKDGPAIECGNGEVQWWRDGAMLSKGEEAELKQKLKAEEKKKGAPRKAAAHHKITLTL